MKQYKIDQKVEPNVMYIFNTSTKKLEKARIDNFDSLMFTAIKELSKKNCLYTTIPTSEGKLILMFEKVFNKKYNK